MSKPTYTYYLTQRPPQIGAMPRKGLLEIEDFDYRQYAPKICMDAWGKVIYDRELTPKEIYDYELTPEMYSVRLTKADIVHIFDLIEGRKLTDVERASVVNKLLEVSA